MRHINTIKKHFWYFLDSGDESKRARRRRRRREKANKAAEDELAEISVEHELMKSGFSSGSRPIGGIITDIAVVGEAKKPTNVGGKKSQQPIAFDIAAMIDAIQVIYL